MGGRGSWEDLDRAVAKSRVTRELFPSLPAPTALFCDRYRLERVLGRGAFGVVVEAHDARLDRSVAIKLVPWTRSVDRRRMLREARALAAVEHAAVVSIFDFGEFAPGELPATDEVPVRPPDDRGGAFIVMELIPGETLATWCRRCEPTSEEIVAVFVCAGRGLAAAHRRGVVHRDFKPGNVMIDDQGRARVVDFGLACGVQSVAADSTEDVETVIDPRSALESRLTETGECWGTLAYMPPEQLRGGAVDARSDQFSFCVALWECLAGDRPFVAHPVEARLLSIERGRDAETIDGIRPELTSVLRRGLRPNPADRFASMDALIAALLRAQRTRRGRYGIALAMPLLVATGLWTGEDATRARSTDPIPTLDDSHWSRHVRAAKLAEAHALLERAADEEAAGRYPKAKALLEKVWSLAIAGGFDRVAAIAGTRLIQVTGVGLREVEQATKWARHAQTRLDLCAPDPELRHDFLLSRGLARHVAGDRPEARRDLTAALSIATTTAEFDPIALARTQAAMANAMRADGQPGRALELYRSAAQLMEATVGDDDVRVAVAWANLSTLEPSPSERARLMRLAVDVFARVAPQHPKRATALVMYSQQLASDDRYTEARAALNEALAIQSAVLAPDDLRLAWTATALGSLALEQGAADAALRAFHRALEVRRLALGDDTPQVAAALANVAIGHRVRGDYGAAREALEDSLAAWERSAPVGASGHLDALDALGVVARLQGHLDESQRLHARALELRETSLGREHRSVAVTLQHLAATLHALGDTAGALGLSARALELLESESPRHHTVAHVLVAHAGYFNAAGDFGKAARAAQRALEIYAEAPAGQSNIPRARFTLLRAQHGEGQRRARAQVTDLLASLTPQSPLATEINEWLETTA